MSFSCGRSAAGSVGVGAWSPFNSPHFTSATINVQTVSNVQTHLQMFEAVEDIKKNNKVRSVVLCSLVPGIFCAGLSPVPSPQVVLKLSGETH